MRFARKTDLPTRLMLKSPDCGEPGEGERMDGHKITGGPLTHPRRLWVRGERPGNGVFD
jgi:hypothetical protein